MGSHCLKALAFVSVIAAVTYKLNAVDPLCVHPHGPKSCFQACHAIAVAMNPTYPKRNGCCDQAGDCYCCLYQGICTSPNYKYQCNSCEKIRIQTSCSSCTPPPTGHPFPRRYGLQRQQMSHPPNQQQSIPKLPPQHHNNYPQQQVRPVQERPPTPQSPQPPPQDFPLDHPPSQHYPQSPPPEFPSPPLHPPPSEDLPLPTPQEFPLAHPPPIESPPQGPPHPHPFHEPHAPHPFPQHHPPPHHPQHPPHYQEPMYHGPDTMY